jgi:hypothetical protein
MLVYCLTYMSEGDVDLSQRLGTFNSKKGARGQ